MLTKVQLFDSMSKSRLGRFEARMGSHTGLSILRVPFWMAVKGTKRKPGGSPKKKTSICLRKANFPPFRSQQALLSRAERSGFSIGGRKRVQGRHDLRAATRSNIAGHTSSWESL